MGATQSSDKAFAPKVWQDHIEAYFDRKMGIGQLAVIDRTLVASPGETVHMPFYKAIGDAEEPAQDAGLIVDKLADDAFSCTVKEVGKAVGWKDKAVRVAANGPSSSNDEAEAQKQIARVFAEKVDKDLITLINTSGNYVTGFTGAANTDKFTISNYLDMKITGFGDKQDQAVAVAMHSLCFATLMKDTSAGFLKADANDPFWGAPGFIGRLLGQALFILDSMPRVSDLGGKKAYAVYAFKPNPFGIYMAKDMQIEKDRDILARENIVAATTWYGVCGFHAKVASNDYRVVRGTFATEAGA